MVKLPAVSGVSQSTIMFGCLIFAFFVFITAKGELSTYLGFFGLGGSASNVGQAQQAAGFANALVNSFNGANLPSSTVGVPSSNDANGGSMG